MRNDAGINGDAQRIEQLAWMLFLKIYDAREDDWEIDDDNYQSIIPEECRWRNWAADDKSGKAMTGDTLLNFVNNTLFPTLKNLNVTPDTPLKKSIVKTTFEDANNYMKDGVLLRQVINVIDELDLSDYEESHAFGEIYESILRELQSAGSAGEFYTPRAVTDFMAKMIKPKIGEKMADFACGTGGFITSWLKELAPQVKTTADQAEYANSIYGIEKKQFPYMLCITNMLLHGLDVPNIYHDNSLLRRCIGLYGGGPV
jgi:type I restriction enzyme M protein